MRAYQEVLPELDQIARLEIRELFFADKVFGFSRENVYPLLDAMRSRWQFSWSCYFHPQLYDADLLEKMKAAGCHTMIIGVDSYDTASLKRYGRTVDKNRIEQLLAHADRLKISVCADFILGLEHETEGDVLRTIRYALDQRIDFAAFNIAAPLPGSGIRKKMIEAGLLHFGEEGFDTCGRQGVLGSAHVSAQRLRELRRFALRKFYLRPSYWLRRLSRTSSAEHLKIQVLEMLSMLKKYR